MPQSPSPRYIRNNIVYYQGKKYLVDYWLQTATGYVYDLIDYYQKPFKLNKYYLIPEHELLPYNKTTKVLYEQK